MKRVNAGGDHKDRRNEMLEVDEKERESTTDDVSRSSPWEVEIDVYLTKACPEPVFEIYTTLPEGPNGIVFNNNHRPGFNITFILHDETGSGYLFPPQSKVKEACWSQVGPTCPESPVWEVFDPIHVNHDRTTLEVYNANPCPALGPFKYTLRVTTDDGASYCALDPGGTDNNGSKARAQIG
jgi:hypothetical protein